jgi:gliding motility-associated-like protein
MKSTGKRLHLLQLILFFLITGSVSAQLHADFSATPTSGCPPLVVSFRDLSTGNPTSYKWDLGNGTQTTSSAPIATYFNPGTYNVKLVVKNALGADSVVKNQYIVVNALPVPAFKISDTSGCFPLKVQFTDQSAAGSGTITSWQWDFGDGNLSNAQSPSHTYTSAGSFTVTLRVTNSTGCSKSITKPGAIVLFNGVHADFDYASAQGCASPTPVTFTNNSTGTGVLTYKWDFGDGNTSTQQNPVHNYITTGNYTIKLIVTNSSGCADTLIKANAVNIGFVQPKFTSPDSVCVGAGAIFTNTSTPATTAATWYFGDGTTANTINAVKAYAAPGIYQVKLVNNFGSCLDSITKSIKVIAKPTAVFTVTNNTSCKAPVTASFTNASTGAVSYSWNFGDGGVSTLANPTHTYNSAGTYTVTLIAKNATGCTDTLKLVDIIQIVPPKINSINNAFGQGCIPFTIKPTATIQTNQPIVSYNWSFGDGSTSTSDTPTHTYTVGGIYSVKLVVTTASGCKDSLTLTNTIMVGSKPKVNFSATPRDVCALIPIQFSDSTTNGPIHQWFWQFGDGGTSTDQHPRHQYGDTGYFNVTLVAFNFGCSDTLVLRDYIYIRPPVAAFDTSFTCADRLTRNFKDKSVDAQSWTWDFGDGNSSSLQNPSHTYAVPGLYKVKLTVTNGTCFNVKEKDVIVIKENGTLTTSDSVGCRNKRISFSISNTNAANIQSYAWYFQGLSQTPVVTYSAPVSTDFVTAGTYPAAVQITDLLNCKDTLYAPVTIKINGPKANFAGVATGTCLGNSISLADSTLTDGIHPLAQWVWSFGDGNSQQTTSSPITYTYGAQGVYNIKMKVTDTYGCSDSITKPAFITISKPVAAIAASDSMACPGTNIQFTNSSTGGVNVQYSWDFGDGNTSSLSSPSHAYATEGNYTIKLVMNDQFGCADSAFVQLKIFNAVSAFSMSDSFSTCPPLLVNFTNHSSSYVQLNWDFGDGGNSQLKDPSHMYTYPGVYTVKLWVSNNGGCTDTLTKYVTIQGPTGVFTYNPLTTCNPGQVDFVANTQNTIKYIWDYNDGTTVFSNQSTSSHTYTTAGKYLPKLILEDASGCRVPIVGNDTLKINGIETHILAQTRLLCDSGLVIFSDSTISNDGISSYSWNFGDGDTSNLSNPTHNYHAAGWYTVSLITRSLSGCADTAVYNNHIKIVTSPAVKMVGDTAACEPAMLTFAGAFVQSDTSVVTWNWNFGNGQQSTLQNPSPQAYATAGNYVVKMDARNSDGCVSTVLSNIVIHPKPQIDAGIDTTICKFNSYTLLPTGGNTYVWTTDATLSCTSCANPVASPLTRRTYYVTGASAFGCTNMDSVTVQVKQPFTVTVNKNDTLCIGQSKQLHASGAELYSWSPAQYLDNANIANPRSTPTSTTTYTVVGHDDHGCFTDTARVTLKVYPIPTIDITNGDAITISVGSSVKLNTISSPDVNSWRWLPGGGLSCITCAEPIASPREITTYAVTASNDGRCVARDQITITPICNNSNIYIPNTFSPNGDGANDVFYARGTGVYSIKNFRVFNRWGQLMYEKTNLGANNASQGWDGTANGIKVQPDVYVYVVEVLCENNQLIPLKGNVTLIR